VDTGSAEAWKLAAQWLRRYIHVHTKCNQKAHPQFLPSRLLDVGTETQPAVSLRITSHAFPEPFPTYVTLSHCWGKFRITKLQLANLAAMTAKDGITVDSLPMTFQDAIVATRRLGVRFLWIDSLCIIQDSIEDWAAESSRMGDIYAGGLCNLAATAATAAPDGRTGCFVNRNPVLARSCRVYIDEESYVRSCKFERPGLYEFVDLDLWSNGILKAPLGRRGWVLQERFMARRALHFGENQLFWECTELVSTLNHACSTPFYSLPLYSR
jgi:hypothetical protein